MLFVLVAAAALIVGVTLGFLLGQLLSLIHI